MATTGPIEDDELEALFSPLRGRWLALAVSGGIDSMVLMHLVARWSTGGGHHVDFPPQPSTPIDPIGLPAAAPLLSARAAWCKPVADGATPDGSFRPPPIVVLTVDHGLRPGSSDDADFVVNEARRLALPVQVLRWSRPNAAAEPFGLQAPVSTRVQERARAARYDLMADVIEDEVWTGVRSDAAIGHPLGPARDRRAIVTAHQREDQVETFLMRLQRGSGLEGLAGMRVLETLSRRPSAARPYPARVDLLRPLLGIARARISATAQQRGISWRDDPSNSDLRFERSRLRRDSPELAALGYRPLALHRSIQRLQTARAALERETRMWMQGDGRGRSGIFRAHAGLFAEVQLTGDADRDPPRHVLEAILRRTIIAWGGCEPEPELARLEALIDELNADGVATRSALSYAQHEHCSDHGAPARLARTLGGCRIERAPSATEAGIHCIRIWRESGRRPLPELLLQPGDGGWWDDRFAVSVAAHAPRPVTVRAMGRMGVAEMRRRAGMDRLDPHLPMDAAATMPGIWDGPELVCPASIDGADDEDRIWSQMAQAQAYRARFAPVRPLL